MVGVDKTLDFCGEESLESEGQGQVVTAEHEDSIHGLSESEADESFADQYSQFDEDASKRQHSTTTEPNGTTEYTRVSGGRAPVHKPVDPDGDSCDIRITQLKLLEYSSQEVADQLVAEGRTRYLAASITARWAIIRKLLEERENQRLDDELSDWHLGEDAKLNKCVKEIEEKCKADIQKIEDRKWKDISESLATNLMERKYTAKACKERWEGLQDGTALLPIEIDPDQEHRQALRENRIVEAKRRRAEEKAEADRIKQAEEDEKYATKLRKWQKIQDKLDAKAAREAEKEEDRRIKAEKKEGKAQRAAAKKDAIEQLRLEAEEKRRVRELEERVYRSITGKHLNRIRGGVSGDFWDNMTNNHSDEDDGTGSKVTADTLLNPRSVMNDDEIQILLHERSLPRRGDNETHPEVIARIAEADKQLTRAELNILLGKYFNKGKGNQAGKTIRLQQYDADNSAAGMKGIKSTDPEFINSYEGYLGR